MLAGTMEKDNRQIGEDCAGTRKPKSVDMSICRRQRVSDPVFGKEKSQVTGRKSQIWALRGHSRQTTYYELFPTVRLYYRDTKF